MRILFFITGLSVGGAEVVTIDLAEQLYDLGNDVTIVYLNHEESAMLDRIPSKIEVKCLNIKKNPISFFKAQIRAKHIIKEFNPDVVHAHMFHAVLFCRLLRLHCKLKCLISTEHNYDIGGNLRMFLYRITDKLSDFNSNVSDVATNRFIESHSFGKYKSATMYNGIVFDKFIKDDEKRMNIRNEWGISASDFVILNVGRLTEAKNQQCLIRCFSELFNKHNSFSAKLLIVGTGHLFSELQEQVKENNLEDRIIFAGNQSDMVAYYSAADCFILTSSWEGLPTVLIEAMAVGLPTITTNAGGSGEVVQNENYVVPCGDEKAIMKKMMEVYEMPKEKLNEQGFKNINLVKKFSVNNVANQWLQVYIKHIQS